MARAAAPLAGAGRVRRQAATAPRDRQAAAVGFTPVQLSSSTPAHLAPLLRSVDVIGLQRTAGNRAVVSLLAPALVQRDTDTFGLLKKDEVTGFAGYALDQWRANPDLSVEEFCKRLMQETNRRLAANGIPQLKTPTFGSSGHAAGGFSHASWSVKLDAASTAKKPLTAKIKDLADDRIAELASVCYHESRHAEQAFLAARLTASKMSGKKDAAALATQLALLPEIAEAAIGSTAPMPGKKSEVKIAEWLAFGPSGKHHDYWEWNEDFRKFVDNLNDSLPAPTPQAANKIIGAWKLASATVAEWKKDTLPFIDKKLGDIKKSSKPDASDQRVSRDLGKIGVDAKKVVTADAALATFVTQFEGRQAEASTRPMTADEARVIQTTFAARWLGLAAAIQQLEITTTAAYEHYPDEEDAYVAKAEVEKAFQAKLKSAARKSK